MLYLIFPHSGNESNPERCDVPWGIGSDLDRICREAVRIKLRVLKPTRKRVWGQRSINFYTGFEGLAEQLEAGLKFDRDRKNQAKITQFSDRRNHGWKPFSISISREPGGSPLYLVVHAMLGIHLILTITVSFTGVQRNS